METGLDIFGKIAEELNLEKAEASTYSPLVLAYVGDAVYELFIRTKVVSAGNVQVNKMHKKSADLVKAETQAKIVRALMEKLTPEELSVYKRGRNAKSYTSAKNASISDYRTATGFEALIGFLYLDGQTDRLCEIIRESLSVVRMEIV